VTAVVIAWSQLRIQQDDAGGRGFGFQIVSDVAVINGVKAYHFEAIIELFGPGDRYEVALHLERDGRQLQPGEPGFNMLAGNVKKMSCNDPPLRWPFNVQADVVDDLWCVASWVEPLGDSIWSHAYAMPLRDRDRIYEWHWYRGRVLRRRIEDWCSRHGPDWFRRRAGRRHALGRWKLHRDLGPGVGQAPIDFGKPPA
jgi:hypothetical protein